MTSANSLARYVASAKWRERLLAETAYSFPILLLVAEVEYSAYVVKPAIISS